MADPDRPTALPAPIIALSGWLLPGLGYVLIGQRMRGLIAGTTIVLTFLAGLLIGGIRVVDVPGYDAAGRQKMVRVGPRGSATEAWALKANFLAEVMNKPWYIAQALVGPLNAAATYGSLAAAPTHAMSTARIFDIGTLYTAVAGMLNLLAIMDATYRSTRPPESAYPEPESSEAGHPFRRENGPNLADAVAVTAASRRSVEGPQ